MYTSAIKKLLFPEDNHYYTQHYPAMVVPLLGMDTDLTALGALLAEDHTCGKHGTVAAVITWICINRPAELADFCNGYGKPGKVYDSIRDYVLPDTISKHFKIHEMVSEAINPTWKQCRDERIGSIGVDKDMLKKAPVSEPRHDRKEGWYSTYDYSSTDGCIDALTEYFKDANFELFFTEFDDSYKTWLEDHYEEVEVGTHRKIKVKVMETTHTMRRKKKTAPSRHNLMLADIDINIIESFDKDGYPNEQTIHLVIRAVDGTTDRWEAKLYAGEACNSGKCIKTIGTFTAKKVIDPSNYKQITTEVEKFLAVSPAGTQQVDAVSNPGVAIPTGNSVSVAKDETKSESGELPLPKGRGFLGQTNEISTSILTKR